MKIRCSGCGVEHFPALGWKHAGCVANKVANADEAVANKVANADEAVANKVANADEAVANRTADKPAVHGAGEPVARSSPSGAVKTVTKHGKYADLDKRRAYQRDLMRARRAKQANGGA